jgi:hypothetical protein
MAVSRQEGPVSRGCDHPFEGVFPALQLDGVTDARPRLAGQRSAQADVLGKHGRQMGLAALQHEVAQGLGRR